MTVRWGKNDSFPLTNHQNNACNVDYSNAHIHERKNFRKKPIDCVVCVLHKWTLDTLFGLKKKIFIKSVEGKRSKN